MSGQACDPDKGCWLLSDCEWNELSFTCVHDPILELTPYTGFVYSLIPIFLGIGILGGLGSGMVKRPILNLLLNYPSNIATQVGDSFLFTTTSLNLFFLFFEKHPDIPELPLVNFDICVIFNQAIPLAWSLGALLSQLFPQLAIYLIQLCFLIGATPFLWKFTFRQRQLEQDKRNNKVFVSEKIKTREEMAKETDLDEKLLNKYEEFYVNDHNKIQIKNICFVIGSFIINQTIILMRSNNYNNSIIGLDPCSVENNLIILVLLGANFIYTSLIYWNKRNEEYYKDLVQYRPKHRFFTPRKIFWQYYFAGWLAGFSTGIIGMGGGIIPVAFLLNNKIIAREAAATAAFGSFMISLNSLLQLFLQKTITNEQLLTFIGLGIIGLLVFTKPAYMLMNKYKVGFVVLIVDIIQVANNIISIVALIIINSVLFGFDKLLVYHSHC
ncbi:unnamed protein product (macronuclear) [Paramecium tetraurelia]|uniref:Uncharacterized protein n=1 Tax=Paramecium tetraurelia TaxID=5888 RepID=A0CP42_PARTE|nr:uncharacterized protein GSPATT00008950001 [Paramecium tetraurelia]CAK72559.1 unnamed protein product [Paramecium tetraurelia]|eukprot:XP_001439956.1 hypothetical protein (macronuclear) [Paramecium tetraurelia strain d4-2]